jgi:predicted esterase
MPPFALPDDQLDALVRIPGSSAWLLVSVQALHPFYTRNDERVVASWMTRLDRDHALADNIAYVGQVLADLRARYATRAPLVFCGFSQGGAMAYRAAAYYESQGLIVLAADVPPDVAAVTRVPLPPVLVGRGTHDEWYTATKQAADERALAALHVNAEACVFEGGHEWTDAFRERVATFLGRVVG